MITTPVNSHKVGIMILYSILLSESGEVENSEFSENSETSENQFPRFSTPSFPFCTIPKTENSEMETSECCFKPFYQTPSFSNSEFSILHYTQNGKLGDENLGVLFQAFLPNSEFSILHYTQNGKLGVGNLRVFSKVYQNSDFF